MLKRGSVVKSTGSSKAGHHRPFNGFNGAPHTTQTLWEFKCPTPTYRPIMPALNACPRCAECSQTAAPFACLLVAVPRRPTKPCFLFRPKKALLRDRKMTSCCFISVTGVQRVCKQTDVQTLGTHSHTQPCKAQRSTIRFSHPSKMAAPEELL